MALLSPRAVSSLLLLLASCLATGQAQTADEYHVKAAFLYNFAKFVEWPDSAFKNSSEPLVICILGRSPFGPLLEQAIQGKQIGGRNLVVRETADPREAADCHLLFIAASEKKRLPAVLEILKATSVLTVGESSNFAGAGGVINFRLDSGKVGLEINLCAAQRARLQISSKLLSLARIVKDDKP
jgi:hypothetical protein